MRYFLLILTVVAVAGFSVEAAESHWAFKSIAKAKPPKVKAKAWALGDVDRFVLNRLEAKGLTPVRDADRHTLLRRATFDLTGLPPTPKEIDAFLQDSSPDAFAKVVDRLLASPRYGERWGRHWLDVVRYADTAGENSDMPVDDAWRYRNYVVHAFNKDTPFDRFIREQLAGDIMSKSGAKISPERYSELITATGYLAISRRHGHDAKKDHYLTIEDTIDTLGKSFLGLTIACARCHDHKFDPISAKDYYGLYGIFASTRYAYPGSEGNRPITDLVPLNPTGELAPRIAKWKTRKAELEGNVAALKKETTAQSAAFIKLASQPRTELTKGIVEIKKEQAFAATVEVRAGEMLQLTVGPRANHGADTAIVEWQIETADGKLKWDITADSLDNFLGSNPHLDRHGNAFVWSYLDARKPGVLLADPMAAVDNHKTLQAWKAGGGLPQAMVNSGYAPVQAWTLLPPRTFYVHPAADGPVAVAWTSPITGNVSLKGKVKDGHAFGDGVDWKLEHLKGDFREVFPKPGQLTKQLSAAEAELKAHVATEMKKMKTPHAYAVSEELPANMKNVALHKRGDPKQPGVIVPRKNLELLGGQSVREGSGRLQLAEWIATADNPLTARVIANRVWLNHFGRGLVSTPNDFGTQGQPPTHPALLDWLATELIRNKWSLKALHRPIMLSATYQTAAAESPAQKLYGAFTPRRLSAEELRDTLLTLSGTLALAMPEGHPFPAKRNGLSQHNPFRANYEHQHRSVYLMVQRIQRRPLMAIFDGADPNASTGQRRLSNVPTQALYFLNNEFLHTHAAGFAKQLAATQDAGVRIHRAHTLALGRTATPVELAEAREFITAYTAAADEPKAWAAWCRVLLSSNEFLFVE